MEMENDCLVPDLPFPELPYSLASARDQALRTHSSSIPSPFSPDPSRTRLTPRLLLPASAPLRPRSMATPRPCHSNSAPGHSPSQRSIPNSPHSFLEFTCIPPIIHVRSWLPHTTPYLFIVICRPSGAHLDSRSSALVPHIATRMATGQPTLVLVPANPSIAVVPRPCDGRAAAWGLSTSTDALVYTWDVFGGLLVVPSTLARRCAPPRCRYARRRRCALHRRPPTSGGGGWHRPQVDVVEVGDRNTYYDRERQRRRTDWEEPIIISSLARPSGELICASPQCRATDAGCGTWPIDRPTIWLLPISTIGRQPLYCVTYFTSAPILFEPIRRPAAPGRRARIFCASAELNGVCGKRRRDGDSPHPVLASARRRPARSRCEPP